MKGRQRISKFVCGVFCIVIGAFLVFGVASYNGVFIKEEVFVCWISGTLFVLCGVKLVYDSIRAA
jgi:hypothetical protein